MDIRQCISRDAIAFDDFHGPCFRIGNRRLGMSMLVVVLCLLSLLSGARAQEAHEKVRGLESDWEYVFLSTHDYIPTVKRAGSGKPINVLKIAQPNEIVDFVQAVLLPESAGGQLPSFTYSFRYRRSGDYRRWDLAANSSTVKSSASSVGSLVLHVPSGQWLCGSVPSREFHLVESPTSPLVIVPRNTITSLLLLSPESSVLNSCVTTKLKIGDLRSASRVDCTIGTGGAEHPATITIKDQLMAIHYQYMITAGTKGTPAEQEDEPLIAQNFVMALLDHVAVDTSLSEAIASSRLFFGGTAFIPASSPAESTWDSALESASHAHWWIMHRVRAREIEISGTDLLPKMVDEIQTVRVGIEGSPRIFKGNELKKSLLEIPGLPIANSRASGSAIALPSSAQAQKPGTDTTAQARHRRTGGIVLGAIAAIALFLAGLRLKKSHFRR